MARENYAGHWRFVVFNFFGRTLEELSKMWSRKSVIYNSKYIVQHLFVTESLIVK